MTMNAQMTLMCCEECGSVLWQQSADQGRCCECGEPIHRQDESLFLPTSKSAKTYKEASKPL